MYTHRSIEIARAKKLLEQGASIDHVLGHCWNAGYLEAQEDEAPPVDAEFDARLAEMNRELDTL